MKLKMAISAPVKKSVAILMQKDRTRKYSEWGNLDPKGHTCYVLTDM